MQDKNINQETETTLEIKPTPVDQSTTEDNEESFERKPFKLPKSDDNVPKRTKTKKQEKPSTNSQGFKKPSIKDYKIISNLGTGAYGEVFLVEHIENKKRFALKRINKMFMMREDKEYQIFAEREILALFDVDEVCSLLATFQDRNYLYFLLEFYNNGDLASQLALYNKFTISETQHYANQMVHILQLLRERGVTHRDIKPQNLMLDKNGNLVLIDFGTAQVYKKTQKNESRYDRIQQIMSRFNQPKEGEEGYDEKTAIQRERGLSFVGTALYASPEMIQNGFSGFESDYWSLGVMVYRMVFGKVPFREEQDFLVFQKITDEELEFPDNYSDASVIPDDLKSFIEGLLNKDPSKRLGCGQEGSDNDFDSLKNHSFLKNMDHQMCPIDAESPSMRRNMFSPLRKKNAFSFGPKTSSPKKFPTNKSVGIFKSHPAKDINQKSLIISLPAKRQKFVFFEVSGRLLMYDDGSITYDQFFDKSTRTLEKIQILAIKIPKNKREVRYKIKEKEYIFKFSKDNFDKYLNIQKKLHMKLNSGQNTLAEVSRKVISQFNASPKK